MDMTRAVEQAVRNDDTLAVEARELALLAIREAKNTLLSGAPSARLAIARVLMPAIARALAENTEAEELADMRQKITTLNQSHLSA
jgi:ABC-type phosphate/phosphonate transport system ATPase subunit